MAKRRATNRKRRTQRIGAYSTPRKLRTLPYRTNGGVGPAFMGNSVNRFTQR